MPADSRDPEAETRRLAAESIGSGSATDWFERLYAAAELGTAVVPWDRGEPHPLLAEWCHTHRVNGTGRSAVVVGCGFGSDAELVAQYGFAISAFDVSGSAIQGARDRYPRSTVDYQTANLLDLPIAWRGAFDFVVEVMTVQALPPELRDAAVRDVTSLVAPGGTLLVIASALDDPSGTGPRDDGSGPPWPLSRADVESFAAGPLSAVKIELIPREDDQGTRWRLELLRTG